MSRAAHRFSKCAFLMLLPLLMVHVSGCGRNAPAPPPVEIRGTREVPLAIYLNLGGLAHQFQRNAGDAAAQASAAMLLDMRKRLGLEIVHLYVIQQSGKVELLIQIADPNQTIWKEVTQNPLIRGNLADRGDGHFRIKLDAFPNSVVVPHDISELTVTWHAGQVVIGSPERLTQIEGGSWSPEPALAVQLCARAASDESLFAFAALPAEGLASFDLSKAQEGLDDGDLVQRLPAPGGMMLTMVASYMDQFCAQLSTTDAIAIGVALDQNDHRHVRLTQLFREEISAEQFQACWLGGASVEGPAVSLGRILQSDLIQKEVVRSGRLLELSATWTPPADNQIRQLAQAATQSLFADALTVELEPTEGDVQTQYTLVPRFVTLSPEELQASIKHELGRQLFPGWAFDQGDQPHLQIELDTFALPNGVLSEGQYTVASVTTVNGDNVLRESDEPAVASALHSGTSFLTVPFQPGTDKSALHTARLVFDLNVPAATEIVEFTASDGSETTKSVEGGTVRLSRIRRDIAEVSYRGDGTPQLIAFDESGRALASRESIRGGGSAAARFEGLISKLWVVFPSQVQDLQVSVDLDLLAGEGLQLPEEPNDSVRVRYDSSAIETYASLREEELNGLSVDLNQAEGLGNQEQLLIRLPRASQQVSAKWELYWLANSRPTSLNGFSYAQNAQLIWGVQEGFGGATAVAGWASVDVPTDFATLRFEKQADAVWQTTQSDNQSVRFQFDRNQISYELGDLVLMAVHAYDQEGRRLKTEFAQQTGGSTSQLVWGQPQRVELVVSARTLQKVIDVQIAKEGTDDVVFGALKRLTPIYHRGLEALTQVQQAANQGPYGYDELAGLHYLHDQDQQPLNLIPKEIAHACPQGADRFGFEPTAYRGYFFWRLPLEGQAPAVGGQERTFQWAEGEIEVADKGNLAIVAVPASAAHPTFLSQWGTTYLKFLRGQDIASIPYQLGQEGWSEISLVKLVSSPGALVRSK